jgi:hypothetical protein
MQFMDAKRAANLSTAVPLVVLSVFSTEPNYSTVLKGIKIDQHANLIFSYCVTLLNE